MPAFYTCHLRYELTIDGWEEILAQGWSQKLPTEI